jgi:trehalose 6-phosphate synthase
MTNKTVTIDAAPRRSGVAWRDTAEWTREDLQHLIDSKLRGARFIAVSNREPYIHRFNGTEIECIQPASGLTVALDPILRATGGTWVAHGSGDADRVASGPGDHVAVPPGAPQYRLRRVWLDRETEERYYYGLANEGLWPLCHIAFQRPRFRLKDWEAYRRANETFAEVVLEEAAGGPALVFIQDSHLALLPRMLKERNPALTVAQFWHIPWPNREVFRAFPWGEELLDGLLGNDLLGFHLDHHCANFMEAVDRGIEARVDVEQRTVARGGGLTRVRPFPISIDFAAHEETASDVSVKVHMKEWRRRLSPGTRFLGIGIDRADYTKGIPERLAAVDRVLEKHPEYRGSLVFLQVAVPSRTHIDSYAELNREIAEIAAAINRKWGTEGWQPVVLWPRHVPQVELMALHRLADFCVVSSLHDGMNLVAKEFVASRADGDGVLILSSFTGAARELTLALAINPFSSDQIADAIHAALTMPGRERRARMSGLRNTVRERNIYRWGADVMRAALEIRAQDSVWTAGASASASGL